MTEIIPGLQGDIPAGFPKGVPFVDYGTKVAACAKHFVGDGGTHKGINENNTIIDYHGLLSIHMPAYYDSVIKGVSTIMGFVISDWQGIDKITNPPHANYSYSVQAGVHAGIDMVMVPYNYTEFIDDLTYQVENNIIPMSRIDDAVRRILRVKFAMGLFEHPLADLSLAHLVGCKGVGKGSCEEITCALKNGQSLEEPLLPLPKKTPASILVAGSHADNLGYQCGGWTMTWQGQGGNNITSGTTILDAIKATVDPTTSVVYTENPDLDYVRDGSFSYAIVVVGETPYAETAGDSLNLTIPSPAPTTIQNVCSVIDCVVVLISGRPVVIEPYVPVMGALVAAWLPGTEGQGVADVLFGDYGFTGKLPRTWFKTVDQLPMNVGDENYDPLFPFGFGLTTHPVNAR
ncbi:Beta-D-xylosidase 4 [Acorus calamus]|uniref:beta-glucosidase n=1 Tax=Acorus calamus TaxID=4465 RepID=A0AAV9C8B7_ACOCL|nr:Beta-D-xylosidase 4 [Acorus calamus]